MLTVWMARLVSDFSKKTCLWLNSVYIRIPVPKEEIPFLIGQVVEITEGPFSDFSGTVEEVLADKGKVRVSVSLFGRPTAVELDYLQLRGH